MPDWSGIWEVDWANKRGIRTPRTQMKLTPEYQKKLDAYRAAQKQGENVQSEAANCVPPGLPGIMSQPYPIEFLYTPGKVVMLIEAYMQFRHIYTDGRKHPDDPDRHLHGAFRRSLGRRHAGGGFRGLQRFHACLPAACRTAIKLRIVERIRKVEPRLDGDRDHADRSGGAGRALHRPRRHTAISRMTIREYICLENNRDSADEKGRPGFSLEKK